MRICVFVLGWLAVAAASAQSPLPDSLAGRLKGAPRDSSYVIHLNEAASSLLRKDPVASRKIANHASEVAKEIQYLRGYARSLNVIGNSYWYQGIYEFAQNYYMLAARYYRDINDNTGLGQVYNNIGEVNKRLGDYDQSLNYLLSSIQLRKGDSTLALTYNNVAELYLLRGNFSEALKYVRASTVIAERFQDRRSEVYNTWVTGRINLARKSVRGAVPYLEQAVEGWKALGESRTLIQTYHDLSEAHRLLGDLSKSSEYLTLARGLESRYQIPELRAQTHLFQAKLDSVKGDFEKAFYHITRHNALRDSLYKISNVEQIARVQAIYETERMDRENAQLRSETGLRNEQLKSREHLLMAISAGLFLLAVFAVILFRQRSRIQRNNTILHQKNEEINNQKRSIELQAVTLMRLNEELQALNKTLETRIEERSKQLIIKNQKLAEYSFVNAHKLRAPVASILGLIHLMEQVDSDERLVVLDHLRMCASQLDAIIQEISRNLESDQP